MFETEHILITGGTGFVGSNIIKKLKKNKDIQITVFSREKEGIERNVEYLKCDLTNKQSIQKNLNKIDTIDRILHLASLNPIRESREICEDVNQNLLSSIYLLELVPENLKNFVFSSTIDVYGIPKRLPINETHQTEPYTYYGACKLASEKFLKIGLNKINVPFTVLRYSQIYGPNDPVIKAIPSFIQKIRNHQSPVIFGDGSNFRDYVYIEDIADATILALSNEYDGVLNLGSGVGYTIKEVLEIIIDIYGEDIKIIFEPADNEPFSSVYDINKAKRILGYSPKFTLRDGLNETMKLG